MWSFQRSIWTVERFFLIYLVDIDGRYRPIFFYCKRVDGQYRPYSPVGVSASTVNINRILPWVYRRRPSISTVTVSTGQQKHVDRRRHLWSFHPRWSCFPNEKLKQPEEHKVGHNVPGKVHNVPKPICQF